MVLDILWHSMSLSSKNVYLLPRIDLQPAYVSLRLGEVEDEESYLLPLNHDGW